MLILGLTSFALMGLSTPVGHLPDDGFRNIVCDPLLSCGKLVCFRGIFGAPDRSIEGAIQQFDGHAAPTAELGNRAT